MEEYQANQDRFVHRAVDWIQAENEVGERLAKEVAKQRKNRLEKRHLTESILQKINQKSAFGKSEVARGISRKSLLGPELTLTPEEEKILFAPHEIVVVYGPKGRLLKAVTSYSADLSRVPSDLEVGSIFTHQHPGGRGPSVWDLDYLARNRHLISRVVTTNERGRKEIFELKIDDSADSESLDAAIVFYRLLFENQRDTSSRRREALELLSLYFPNTFVVSYREL